MQEIKENLKVSTDTKTYISYLNGEGIVRMEVHQDNSVDPIYLKPDVIFIRDKDEAVALQHSLSKYLEYIDKYE